MRASTSDMSSISNLSLVIICALHPPWSPPLIWHDRLLRNDLRGLCIDGARYRSALSQHATEKVADSLRDPSASSAATTAGLAVI